MCKTSVLRSDFFEVKICLSPEIQKFGYMDVWPLFGKKTLKSNDDGLILVPFIAKKKSKKFMSIRYRSRLRLTQERLEQRSKTKIYNLY